ncbi:21638_t:CDS:1 [Gigaspora margarita]|uniref:21638_t:CDS:1 n=1 Tax=Gigaspora margarita TaxID=4874 RepID=A0ABN7VPU0_GIGMA|nr:21638_t:CDS:1 [Gigaspora margarita]
MNSIDCSKYIRNYLLAILFFVFFYINNIYGTQLTVDVPKGTHCFFGVYFPKDGSGNNTGNSVPVQTNLDYQIRAYSGVPSDGVCTGICLANAANLIPTDNDLKNDIWKINITNFELC